MVRVRVRVREMANFKKLIHVNVKAYLLKNIYIISM